MNAFALICLAMKPTEAETADYVISPLTGEKIPANKIQEHMRIGKVVYTSLKLAAFMKCIAVALRSWL